MDRRSALVVLAVLAIGVTAGGLYVLAASERYEARAELLVTPAQRDSPLGGIGLLEDTDETAAADTAAQIVESGAVASAVATRLRVDADEAREAVDAHRVGDSNVVALVARAGSPRRATQIADTFADETVSQRAEAFQAELRTQIARASDELLGIPAGTPRATELREKLAAWRALQGTRDPTVRVLSNAVASADPVWPKVGPTMLLALAASLLLGLALAMLLRPRREPEPAPEPPPPPRDVEPDLRALERRSADASARAERRAAELDRGLAGLEGRITGLTGQMAALVGRIGALEAGNAELEARIAEFEQPPEPEPEPDPEPEPEPARPVPAGGFTLERLEAMASERRRSDPAAADELDAYVDSLRVHANAEGRLPRSFDALIEDVFGEAPS